MKAVFLDKQTFSSNLSLATIEQQVSELTCFSTSETSEVITRCLDAEIIITNKVVLNAEVLADLPKLKLICITATGFNSVDLKASSRAWYSSH